MSTGATPARIPTVPGPINLSAFVMHVHTVAFDSFSADIARSFEELSRRDEFAADSARGTAQPRWAPVM